MNAERTLPWDWYAGAIPENVVLRDGAHLQTTFSFHLYQSSRNEGLVIDYGASIYNGTMFDVGPEGRVTIGAYAMVNEARIVCDAEVAIGPYTLIAWNVVIMDTYRIGTGRADRRAQLQRLPQQQLRRLENATSAKPVQIERNVWVGFDCCILPGVTIGEGSVIGARSVVASDIPPFTVAAGNPARVVRAFTREEIDYVDSHMAETICA
jgi:acetyltransferase-like isoleucine patch superfamily enzyme